MTNYLGVIHLTRSMKMNNFIVTCIFRIHHWHQVVSKSKQFSKETITLEVRKKLSRRPKR